MTRSQARQNNMVPQAENEAALESVNQDDVLMIEMTNRTQKKKGTPMPRGVFDR